MPLSSLKEPFMPAKDPSIYPQKSHIYIHKRALYTSTKEPYVYPQKSHVYIHKRAIYIPTHVYCAAAPPSSVKEPFTPAKDP